MRAKFKVLSGERLCEKAFGVNLGEFNGSKSAFASDKSYKSTLTNEVKGLKNALASKFDGSKGVFVGDESHKNAFINEFKNLKSTLACEFNGLKNALTSKIKNSKSAFVGEFDSHENAFASLCERTKFKNERVKKNFGVGISLSLSLVSASTLCAECA